MGYLKNLGWKQSHYLKIILSKIKVSCVLIFMISKKKQSLYTVLVVTKIASMTCESRMQQP